MTQFYKMLYTSKRAENMEAVLNIVPSKVTSQMNDNLIATFKEQETKDALFVVKNALFHMFPTKAPGPNRYPAHFFQCHWDLCGAK